MRTGVLEEFLRHERDRIVSTAPAFFEVAFGRAGPGRRDSLLGQVEALAVGVLRLSGKIDRIDLGEGCFAVVDYKSGHRHPRFNEIEAGTSLQIPLYLRAAEQLLQEAGHRVVPAAGFYYGLTPPVHASLALGSKTHKGTAIPGRQSAGLQEDDTALRAVIDRSVAFAEGYVQGMAAGLFPLTTPERGKDVCTWCAFGAMCRVRSARSIEPEEQEEA